MNEELLKQPDIQALFEEFKYDMDEERRKEIEKEEKEKEKRNREAAARFVD